MGAHAQGLRRARERRRGPSFSDGAAKRSRPRTTAARPTSSSCRRSSANRARSRDGDACIFFNFRPDRARQLTLAFSDPKFDHFPVRRYDDFVFATMTRYEENFPNPVLFGPRPQYHVFGEVVADAGLSQLRLAETEKYAHVTYFFNGGREDVFPGEDRILIPSNRSVATYDLAPEMSANDITTAAVEDVSRARHDVIVMNYANADMVGHTGVWDATVSAVETLDVALGRLEQAVLDAGGILAITSDHGNAEEKIDARRQPAHRAHDEPGAVRPRLAAAARHARRRAARSATSRRRCSRCSGLPVPVEMTGRNLLAHRRVTLSLSKGEAHHETARKSSAPRTCCAKRAGGDLDCAIVLGRDSARVARTHRRRHDPVPQDRRHARTDGRRSRGRSARRDARRQARRRVQRTLSPLRGPRRRRRHRIRCSSPRTPARARSC